MKKSLKALSEAAVDGRDQNSTIYHTVRACRIIGISLSAAYYTSRKDDSEVILKLQSLAQQLPTRGVGVYYGRIRNEGLIWNHKRVKRVYDLLKLNLRRKHKRRLPNRENACTKS